MARLYANENFPLKVVQQLRALGHDVLTVAEAGNAGQRIPDHEVLAYAVKSGRAILTINRRDFIRPIHACSVKLAVYFLKILQAAAMREFAEIVTYRFTGMKTGQSGKEYRTL